MKLFYLLIVVMLSVSPLWAQGEYEDHIQAEANRYKTGGIAMLIGGTAMIGGGAAMIYNDSEKASAMGVAMIALGTGVDVASIFMFRKRKNIIEDARAQESVPVSFIVSPQGVQLSIKF